MAVENVNVASPGPRQVSRKKRALAIGIGATGGLTLGQLAEVGMAANRIPSYGVPSALGAGLGAAGGAIGVGIRNRRLRRANKTRSIEQSCDPRRIRHADLNNYTEDQLRRKRNRAIGLGIAGTVGGGLMTKNVLSNAPNLIRGTGKFANSTLSRGGRIGSLGVAAGLAGGTLGYGIHKLRQKQRLSREMQRRQQLRQPTQSTLTQSAILHGASVTNGHRIADYILHKDFLLKRRMDQAAKNFAAANVINEGRIFDTDDDPKNDYYIDTLKNRGLKKRNRAFKTMNRKGYSSLSTVEYPNPKDSKNARFRSVVRDKNGNIIYDRYVDTYNYKKVHNNLV